jgi:uncharacterized protein
MKVFVFSDTHGKTEIVNKIKKSNPDLVICLGDFTLFGSNQKNILEKFNDIGKKFILIHGNHESYIEIKKDIKNLKNIILLHKEVYKINGFLFAGFGGGGFSFIEKSFKDLENKINKNEENEIILLTHGPPFGTKLDHIDDFYVGCKNYTNFIKKFKPKYAFSGHIHENSGVKDIKHGSILINPGKEGIEIIL